MEVQDKVFFRRMLKGNQSHKKARLNRVQDNSESKRPWNTYHRLVRFCNTDGQDIVFRVNFHNLYK